MLRPIGVLLFVLSGVVALADIPAEKAAIEVLPDHTGQQWFWVWGNGAPSKIDGRAFLFNDDGKLLAQTALRGWESGPAGAHRAGTRGLRPSIR